jgi:hypothetical protein
VSTPANADSGWLRKPLNAMPRYLWRDGAIHAAGRDPWRQRFYPCKRLQKKLGKAKIAAVRKLGFHSGFCCAIRLITKGSAAAGRCGETPMVPMEGCLEAVLAQGHSVRLVRIAT